jgi:UDP-N-acetylglucosamine acyltransferase
MKSPESRIHPAAIIAPAAVIADDVVVGPGCLVGPEVSIAEGTVLQSGVVLAGKVTIGRNNLLCHHVVIGSPAQLQKDLGLEVGVVIGDNTVFRESVTINAGTERGGGPTRIGSYCYLMIGAHVAHDCIVGDHVELINNVLLGGHVKVEEGAILSGASGVHHFVTVGKLAFAGGMSRIIQDVPPFMLVDGNPARVRGVNVVGLRRAGFDESRINALKRAHRIFYRSKLSRTKAAEALRAQPMTPDIDYLLTFVQSTAGGKQGRGREALRKA